jgi:pyruvate dehydrogenase E2 component (dihydrolipoamide acetyltransferase)
LIFSGKLETMAEPVIMPRQGQSVESCIISSWYKKKGDHVAKGDILLSYETDKAAFELEADSEGILLERLFEEGDEVPVLETVAWVGVAGEEVEGVKGVNSRGPAVPGPVGEDAAGRGPAVPGPGGDPVAEPVVARGAMPLHDGGDGRTKISPRARHLAERMGLRIDRIEGSGPYGRIVESDVLAASLSQAPATPLARAMAAETGAAMPDRGTGPGGRVTAADLLPAGMGPSMDDSEEHKLSNMRRIIARKMHESLQNSAQLTHHTSADARKLLALRKKAKEAFEKGTVSENITINDLVCYAVIRVLKKNPQANSHFLGDRIRVFRKVHLGLAVDTERGLMVPVVRNADDLNITRLASEMKDLAAGCRKGSINPELLDSEAASFSVSNLGAYGVELFTPVINLPQVAILGVNTIINRPADLGNGVFGFVPFIGLSLTYDHRALDGAPASAFLRDIRLEIENLEINL